MVTDKRVMFFGTLTGLRRGLGFRVLPSTDSYFKASGPKKTL